MAEHNPSGTLQYYILSKLAHFSAGGASTPELRGAGLLARARQAGPLLIIFKLYLEPVSTSHTQEVAL